METHGVQSAGQSTDSCHLTWGGMGYCYSRSFLSPLKVVFITCAFSKTNEQTNKQTETAPVPRRFPSYWPSPASGPQPDSSVSEAAGTSMCPDPAGIALRPGDRCPRGVQPPLSPSVVSAAVPGFPRGTPARHPSASPIADRPFSPLGLLPVSAHPLDAGCR